MKKILKLEINWSLKWKISLNGISNKINKKYLNNEINKNKNFYITKNKAKPPKRWGRVSKT